MSVMRNQSGSLLITALIAVFVVSVGIFFMSSYILSLYKAELNKYVTVRARRIQQNIVSAIRSDVSWVKTISDTENADAMFDCLAKKNCTKDPKPFTLRNPLGVKLTNCTVPQQGLTLDGEPCFSFSTTKPDSQCPLRFELSWVVDCQSCVFQAPRIMGKLLFSHPEEIPFNPDLLEIDFARGKEAETVGETCASMKGILDTTTGVCKLPFAGNPCAAAKSMSGTLHDGRINCIDSPGLGYQSCPQGMKPIGVNSVGEVLCEDR